VITNPTDIIRVVTLYFPSFYKIFFRTFDMYVDNKSHNSDEYKAHDKLKHAQGIFATPRRREIERNWQPIPTLRHTHSKDACWIPADSVWYEGQAQRSGTRPYGLENMLHVLVRDSVAGLADPACPFLCVRNWLNYSGIRI